MPRGERVLNGIVSNSACKEPKRSKRKTSAVNYDENRQNISDLKKSKITREPEDKEVLNETEAYQFVSLTSSVKKEELDIKPAIKLDIKPAIKLDIKPAIKQTNKQCSHLKNNGNHRSSSPLRRVTRRRARELDELKLLPAPTIPFNSILNKNTSVKKQKLPLKRQPHCSTEKLQETHNSKKKSLIRIQEEKSVPLVKNPKIKTEMKKFVGAHLSITGGLENVIHEARAIGAKAVGLFLKSQRTWKSKPLEEKSVEKFRKACEDHNFPTSKILPHGSYLLNCGSSKPDLLSKSRENLIDDLHRCDRLGIELFNFHPGSTCGEITVSECVAKIADSINIAHKQTDRVTVVIENMSCQGHTLGGKFEELRDIIDQVKDKQRIGVCLDTCHAFAAGFDLSTKDGYEQMMADFENIIGLEYLKAIHLNDSKGEVGCHKDRHENIGKGKIGLDGFRHLMNDPRLDDIPMILETPMTIDDQKEIETLYAMVNTKL